MDVPDSYAIGFRPRRYCLPAVLRSNSVDIKPLPLGMIRQPRSASYATPVLEVMPYGGKGPVGPGWGYYYSNTKPDFNKDKTYFGDPRNVYWPTRYYHCAGVNCWEKTATNISNYKDFHAKKHWDYPFSYWARFYWNQPVGVTKSTTMPTIRRR